MAAHAKTILEQFLEESRDGVTHETRKTYIHALNYAPGMDLLLIGDWVFFLEALNSGADCDIISIAKEIHAKVSVEWEALGQPATLYDWRMAQHGA